MAIILGTGGGTLSVTAASPSIYSGVISGTSLTKSGSGDFSITTTETYTGSTTITGGTLRLRTGPGQLPTGTDLTITSPGAFDPASFGQTVNSLSGNGNVAFASASTLTVNGTPSTVYSGAITGGGSFTVNKSGGAGTITLRGNNSYSGLFTLTAGGVNVAAGASLCGTTCDVSINGGTLSLTNTSQSVEDFGGTGGTVILNSGVTLNTSGTIVSSARSTNYAGVITGPGNLNVAAGIQTLSGPNTYTGTTTVQSGAALKVYNATALGDSGTGTTVNSGGAVQIAGTYTIAEPLTLNGLGTNSINGALRNTGQNNTWSGPLTLGSSGVRINSDSGTLTLSGGVTGAGDALTIGGAGTVAVSTSPIDIGGAALTKDGSGTLTLVTANTCGNVSVSAGRINVQATDCLGQGAVTISPTAGIIIANNGSVDVTITNNFTINSSSFLTDISANSGLRLILNGKISGAGTWKKDNTASTGTLVLNNGANDYTGNQTNFAGILVAGADGALGTTAGMTTINSGATLGFQNSINYATAEPVVISGTGRQGQGAIASISGDNSFAGPITLGADSSIGAPLGSSLTLNGDINGGFALTKTNSGTVTLTGNGGYTGNTTVQLGALALSGNASISSSPAIIVNAGASLDVSGLNGGVLTLANGQTLKGNGGVSGAVVVASGATVAPGTSIGTLYFTNAPTLSGTVAVEIDRGAGQNADKLVVVSGGGTVAYGGTLTVANLGAALQVNDTFDLFDADAFSGSFTSMTLPSLAAGLAWDTSQLTVNGTIKVVCNGTLTASASPSGNTNICSGSSVQLNASASGGSGTGYTYSWSPATGLSTSSIANPVASPSVTTMYTVTVTDAAGCTAQANVTVGVDVAPMVTAQLTNTTVCSGTAATLTVGASGSGLSYSWAKHNNGGWGSTWSTSGSGATFRGTSTQNNFGDAACTGFSSANDINNVSGNALGMWGGFSGDEVATRDFAALSAGQDVSVDFDNGNVDSVRKVGFALEDSSGSDILQFYFLGGQSNFKYWDIASSEQDTGIGFQRTGLRVQFILLSSSSYKLIVTTCGGSTSTFTGSYSGTISRLKLFNQNNTGGDDKNIYFNNFIVGGYVDNADNYSGDYAGQDKGDQPILSGNGASSYTTPTLTTADSGAQYEAVVAGCGGVTLSSAATVTVNAPATVSAGPNQTVCANSPATTLAGSFGGGVSSATWSGGAGNFVPDNTTTNATYTPSASEIAAGSVTLTLTTDPAGPCGAASASMTITIDKVTATNVTFVRAASASLKISKTNLLAHVSDRDAETLTFAGVGTDGVNLLTTNGVTLQTDANWIFYKNSVTANVNDSFAYKVMDARGCVALGTVFINVLLNESGQSTGIVVSNGVAILDFAGIPGRAYQVQRSTNLVNWVALVTTNAPSNGIFEWVDDFSDLGVPPADPPSSAYYQLRVP
jgi:autotransporter-associated beta strand protein